MTDHRRQFSFSFRRKLLTAPWFQGLFKSARLLLNPPNKRRLLAVWDFNEYSGVIGDAILFQASALAQCHRLELEQVDYAFIDDPSHINAGSLKFKKSRVLKDNIISLCDISPRKGAVFRFDKSGQFRSFLRRMAGQYHIFPPFFSDTKGFDPYLRDFYAASRSMSPEAFILPRLPYDVRYITDCIDRTGTYPKLKCPKDVREKITVFLKEKIYPAKPVVFQIRNRDDFCARRNSNAVVLEQLIRQYTANKEFVFIGIGSKQEIVEEFREIDGVYFSKDYFDTLLEDLALVEAAFLTIFPNSGPMCFGWLSDAPYLELYDQYFPLSEVYFVKIGQVYPFTTRFQRRLYGGIDFKRLEQAFISLSTDIENAQNMNRKGG
jgi:hypothetical protein